MKALGEEGTHMTFIACLKYVNRSRDHRETPKRETSMLFSQKVSIRASCMLKFDRYQPQAMKEAIMKYTQIHIPTQQGMTRAIGRMTRSPRSHIRRVSDRK